MAGSEYVLEKSNWNKSKLEYDSWITIVKGDLTSCNDLFEELERQDLVNVSYRIIQVVREMDV